MPKKASPELHQVKLSSLETLKEGRKNRGCKSDLANYLNWLYSKVHLYENYQDGYEKLVTGSQFRSIEEYKQASLGEITAFQEKSEKIIREKIAVAQQQIDIQRNAVDAEVAEKERYIDNRMNQAEMELSHLTQQINAHQKTLHAIDEKQLLESVGYYDYDNPAQESVRLKKKLDEVKASIKRMQKEKRAINATTGFTYNNSASEGKKFTKDFSDLMLTAYNQEVENAIVKLDRTRSLDVAVNRVEKSREKVAKLGKMLSASITDEYHELRIQEILIAFQYKDMETARKEYEKEERERLREEAKIRGEAEKAAREAEEKVAAKRRELQALLSYQQQHYTNVADQLEANSTQSAPDPRVEALKAQIEELEDAKNDANVRLANTKAGYVYIISNIGSFGEGIVKIGMTRRLNPEDRVKELSSASVPFIFDTHAIHFSNDAVGLERKLHKHFDNRRVNKVNLKKEYFRVGLDEVKDALVKFSGDGATLKFSDEAIASDYRKSVKM